MVYLSRTLHLAAAAIKWNDTWARCIKLGSSERERRSRPATLHRKLFLTAAVSSFQSLPELWNHSWVLGHKFSFNLWWYVCPQNVPLKLSQIYQTYEVKADTHEYTERERAGCQLCKLSGLNCVAAESEGRETNREWEGEPCGLINAHRSGYWMPRGNWDISGNKCHHSFPLIRSRSHKAILRQNC